MINTETQLNQMVQVRGSKYNSGGEMRRQFTASFLAIEVEEVGESSASAALIELHNEVQKEVSSTTTITKNVEKEQDIRNEELPHTSNTTLIGAEFDANTGEVIIWKGKSSADVQKDKELSNPDESFAAKEDTAQKDKELSNPDESFAAKEDELHSKITEEERKNPNPSMKVLAETKKYHVIPSSEKVTNAKKKVKQGIGFSDDDQQKS